MTMGSLSAGISAQRVRGGAGPVLHIVMTSSVRYGGFCSAPQLVGSRRNHLDLRSRQFFLGLKSPSRSFHDGRRAFVDLQESWFHQRKRTLPAADLSLMAAEKP